MRISGGQPVVVLSNRHAYTWHTGLRSWLRVADDSFPTSAHHASLLPFAAPSDLQRLQYEAALGAPRHDVLAATLQQPAHVQKKQNRGHLEVNVAAALAMGLPAEWRRWMLTYVRFLSAEADEVRSSSAVQISRFGTTFWFACQGLRVSSALPRDYTCQAFNDFAANTH